MENIVRLNYDQLVDMRDALNFALSDRGYGTARVCTGEDSRGKWVKYDVGVGWSPPIHGVEF